MPTFRDSEIIANIPDGRTVVFEIKMASMGVPLTLIQQIADHYGWTSTEQKCVSCAGEQKTGWICPDCAGKVGDAMYRLQEQFQATRKQLAEKMGE